jgi:hypothetical protein
MRRTTTILAAILTVGLAMAPAAAAHHADDRSDANVEGDYYVTVDEDDGLTLWEETNGHEGLQTSATTYAPGDDGCVGDDRPKGDVCAAPADAEVEL